MNMKDFLDNKPNKELKNIVWYNFFKDSNIVRENPKWDWIENKDVITRKELGLFYWERGGKHFTQIIERDWNIKEMKSHAEVFVSCNERFLSFNVKEAQDFLDCLACLGTKKIKELIEAMK